MKGGFGVFGAAGASPKGALAQEPASDSSYIGDEVSKGMEGIINIRSSGIGEGR